MSSSLNFQCPNCKCVSACKAVNVDQVPEPVLPLWPYAFAQLHPASQHLQDAIKHLQDSSSRKRLRQCNYCWRRFETCELTTLAKNLLIEWLKIEIANVIPLESQNQELKLYSEKARSENDALISKNVYLEQKLGETDVRAQEAEAEVDKLKKVLATIHQKSSPSKSRSKNTSRKPTGKIPQNDAGNPSN